MGVTIGSNYECLAHLNLNNKHIKHLVFVYYSMTIINNDSLNLSPEDNEMLFYTTLCNIFQKWYNKTCKPSYLSMIEDTNDEMYTNGSLECFYDFMADFKENINNISMTRIYEFDDFITHKHNEKYQEYYVLTIVNNDKKEYASPLLFSLLIFMIDKEWQSDNWSIDIYNDEHD